MSKRDRHLKQRLDELFSPPTEPAPAQPETTAGQPEVEPTGLASSIGRAASAVDVSYLKTVIEQLPLPAYLKDREHTWVAVNAAFAQLNGHTPESLLGHTDKEQADDAWQLDDRVLDSGQQDLSEDTSAQPDGSIRTRRIRRTPLLNAQHKAEYVMGVVQDTFAAPPIQTQAQAAAAIDENLSRDLFDNTDSFLNSVFENLPVALFMKDAAELRFVHWNRIMADLIGPTRDEVIGKNDYDFFPPAEAEFFITKDREVLSSGQMLDIPEEPIETRHHGQRLLHTRKVPLYAADGAPKYLLGISEDITDRKRVEAERERLLANMERRAVQLQTASEISNAVSTILELGELLPFVVERIQQRFDLYYVGLFLVDVPRQYAILRAATGEVGQQMLTGRYQLALDDHSMIGWCIQHQAPRIALDVGEDAVRFNNPHLPDTRSELALPLVSRGQVLGAMTVQSAQAAAFSEQDVIILQTMSNQVATAIANAQLLEQASLARRQAETRLRETQFLRSVGQAVSSSLDLSSVMDVVVGALEQELGFTHIALALVDKSAGTISIPRAAGTAAALQGLTRSIDELHHDILLDVLNKGQIEVLDGWDDRFDREIYERQGHAALVRAFVPLQLRGESIGLLEVGYDRTERTRITPEEVRLLGSLADQIAIAVGNARLFKESQQRVTELAVVNEIGRTLTLTQDIQQLFVTIHQQISRLFDASNFYIATYDGGDEWSLDYQIEHNQVQPVTQHKLGGGLTSYILQTRQPILFRSEQEDLAFHDQQHLPTIGEIAKSWMGVPLIASGSIIGAMGIQSYEHEGLYTEQDAALFSTIGTQAATAIQNAHLLEQAKNTARREQILREITSRVRSTTDPDTIARTAIRELGLALGRQTFIQLGDAEQLSRAPQVSQEVPASGNGLKADGEGGR